MDVNQNDSLLFLLIPYFDTLIDFDKNYNFFLLISLLYSSRNTDLFFYKGFLQKFSRKKMPEFLSPDIHHLLLYVACLDYLGKFFIRLHQFLIGSFPGYNSLLQKIHIFAALQNIFPMCYHQTWKL